jgi:RNA polymerase sigma-70 factor (ECF subfamily)
VTLRESSRPPTDTESGRLRRASTPDDDIHLVARCQRGDAAAFDQLYRMYRRQVAGNLVRLVGNRPDVEDTLQEVFIEVFRSIGRFRGEARLSTWLYRVTTNVAYRRLRTRRRKEPPAFAICEELPSHDPDPERQVQSRHDFDTVHRLLDGMAPKKRMVFVLHELEGLEIDEIATIVGAPRVTVRTRLHYARKEFYALASKLDYGPESSSRDARSALSRGPVSPHEPRSALSRGPVSPHDTRSALSRGPGSLHDTRSALADDEGSE